jgi:hypothetical protein
MSRNSHLPDRAAVEGRKILSAIRFRAKTELKPIPYIYDEEISKLRDAPWDAETRDIAAKLPTFDTKNSSLYRTHQKKLEGKFYP